MPKNHPKIYTKPQNIGECSKWRDLALLETLSDVKTAFRLFKKNPVVRLFSSLAHHELTLNPFFQHCSNKILT